MNELLHKGRGGAGSWIYCRLVLEQLNQRCFFFSFSFFQLRYCLHHIISFQWINNTNFIVLLFFCPLQLLKITTLLQNTARGTVTSKKVWKEHSGYSNSLRRGIIIRSLEWRGGNRSMDLGIFADQVQQENVTHYFQSVGGEFNLEK